MLSEANLRRHEVAMELVGKELDVLVVLVDSGLKRRMGERRKRGREKGKEREVRETRKEREQKKEENRRDGRRGREGEEKREKVGDHSLAIYQCELLLN